MVPSFLANSPEYEARRRTVFTLPQTTLADIHSAVPKHFFEKSTATGLYYVLRSVTWVVVFYRLALHIPLATTYLVNIGMHPSLVYVARIMFWAAYWWWQGVAFAGLWCLGHEAGHGTIADYSWVNTSIGFVLHTFLLVPYYSWRATHHAHHKTVGSIEREENYVPRTRSDFALPAENIAHVTDYHDVFEETPIYTLGRMILMQLLGWQAYLCFNTLGSPSYPEGTNHFSTNSPLFKDHQRRGVAISNLGLTVVSCILIEYSRAVGGWAFFKLYFVPYLLANHWIVMLTFLHHTDPTLPHYREKQWTWLRGALATVDRPLLGWVGRHFLHNVSHDHVSHHLFSSIPFYNQPQVTEILKNVLKHDYNYDSTNSFKALWRSFTECIFIEDDGDVVFYKNRSGQAVREHVIELDSDS
ncbi:hypothetical protein PENSPDRAFT_642592 [Peniophora sp. CONT]|nr:hypothetical protein PENSPDRAFT_642592 [Peniophora sp. CONT]